jgi:hypothetical protein
MNVYLAMVLGCIGGGIYAIVKRTLPIGPRRKLIDGPAIRLGVVLIALPFANAVILLASRWIAATYFPDSRSVDHWSVMGPLIFFPLSLAGCLTAAKQWSVPKYYSGDWASYTPYQPVEQRPDFSMFETLRTDDQDDR